MLTSKKLLSKKFYADVNKKFDDKKFLTSTILLTSKKVSKREYADVMKEIEELENEIVELTNNQKEVK